MAAKKMKLQIDGETEELLENRHISPDEVRKVIGYAETEGKKLWQPEVNRYLAKLRIGSAAFYVEYSIEPEKYVVHSAYAHKAEMAA